MIVEIPGGKLERVLENGKVGDATVPQKLQKKEDVDGAALILANSLRYLDRLTDERQRHAECAGYLGDGVVLLPVALERHWDSYILCQAHTAK
jgi:hypothetical protein